MTNPKNQGSTPAPDAAPVPETPEKVFHGWRLLGVIVAIMVVLAIVSAVVDWIHIGPLEGRVF